MLGLYVSDHPLMGAEAALRRRTDCTHRRARRASRTATSLTVGGVVTSLPAQVHQEGRPDGRLRPRGPAGVDRGDGLPEDHEQTATSSPTTPSSCVKGRVDGREDDAQADVPRASPCSRPSTDGAPPLRIRLSPNALDRGAHRAAQAACSASTRASRRCSSHLGERQVLRLPDEFRVDARPGSWPSCGCCSGPTPSPPERAGRRRSGPLGAASRGRRDGRMSATGATRRTDPRAVDRRPSTLGGNRDDGDRGRDQGLHGARATPSSPRWPTSAPMGLPASRSVCCRRPRRPGCSSPSPATTGKLHGFSFCTLERIGGTPERADRPGVA